MLGWLLSRNSSRLTSSRTSLVVTMQMASNILGRGYFWLLGMFKTGPS